MSLSLVSEVQYSILDILSRTGFVPEKIQSFESSTLLQCAKRATAFGLRRGNGKWSVAKSGDQDFLLKDGFDGNFVLHKLPDESWEQLERAEFQLVVGEILVLMAESQRAYMTRNTDELIEDSLFCYMDVAPPKRNSNPDALVLTKQLSKFFQHKVFQTEFGNVVKFLSPNQKKELVWSKFVPNGIPVRYELCLSNDSFSFRGNQAVQKGHYAQYMPMCQVLSDNMKPSQVHRVMQQTLPQLMILHMMGCTHNDIKPENIMAERDNLWRLADFGVCEPWINTAFELCRPCMGTQLYQYDSLCLLRMINGCLRDTFGLASSVFEVATGSRIITKAPEGFTEVQMYQQDMIARLYGQNFQATKSLLKSLLDQANRQIIESRLDHRVKQALLELVSIDTSLNDFAHETNVFRAAKAYFGDSYDDVKREVVQRYIEYCESLQETWSSRHRMESAPSQLLTDLQRNRRQQILSFSQGVISKSEWSIAETVFTLMNPGMSLPPAMFPFKQFGAEEILMTASDYEDAQRKLLARGEDFLRDVNQASLLEIIAEWEKPMELNELI